MAFMGVISVRCHPIPWTLNRNIAKLRWKYGSFNLHTDGLCMVRAWVYSMLVCIVVGVIMAGCEIVMQDVFGPVYDYTFLCVYLVLVVKYGM
jgi:hypothetical protein